MTGSVKDIKYSESAFDSLVLPQDHRELILALAYSKPYLSTMIHRPKRAIRASTTHNFMLEH